MPTTLTKKTLANVFSAFTRASTAMRWNEQGVLESVAANLPRIDHDPNTKVTNMVTQSEFPNGVVDASGTNVVATTLTGFLNFTTGIHFNGGAASAIARKSPPLLPNTTYTVSAYIRMDDGSAPVAGSTTAVGTDLSMVLANAPIAAANHTVAHVANNVYRVSAWLTTGATIANLVSGVWKYAAQSAKTFKMTGLQIEVGSTASRYVKTLTTPVTNCLPRGLLLEDGRTNLAFPSQYATGDGQYYDVTEVASLMPGRVARRYAHKGVGTPPANPSGVQFTSTGYMTGWTIVESDPTSPVAAHTRLTWWRTVPTPASAKGIATLNLTTGVITATAGLIAGCRKLMDVGPNGGVVWIFWTTTNNPDGETLNMYPYPCGDGTGGMSVINHHFQVEASNFPTSPIPTTTAAATRAHESFRIEKQDWYNPLASTLVIEYGPGTVFSNTTSGSGPYYAHVALVKNIHTDGTFGIGGNGSLTPPGALDGQSLMMAWSATNGVPMLSSRNFPAGGSVIGGKIAVTTDGIEQQGTKNGVLANAAPLRAPMTAGLANVDRLYAGGWINGWIKAIRYLPRRLTDAELIAISAP